MKTGIDHRWTELDGIPSHDDPELTELMEAVRRLPRDRAETFIESALRSALGYERTGNEEFLTNLASSALVAIRARRDPEDQKALDAPPAEPVPGDTGIDVSEVFARYAMLDGKATG